MIYVDDVMLFSINGDEYLENLETVLSLLKNAELTIKPKKIFLLHASIE